MSYTYKSYLMIYIYIYTTLFYLTLKLSLVTELCAVGQQSVDGGEQREMGRSTTGKEKKTVTLSPLPVIASFQRHNNNPKLVGIDELDCATKTQVDTKPTCVFSHWQRCKKGQEETSAWTEIASAMSNSANVSTHSSICRTPPLVPPCLCFCPTARPLHRCVTIVVAELCQANC